MLKVYLLSSVTSKALGYLYILLSSYFLTAVEFNEQQVFFRYILGLSALIFLGSNISFRRYIGHYKNFAFSTTKYTLISFGLFLIIYLTLQNKFIFFNKGFLNNIIIYLFICILLQKIIDNGLILAEKLKFKYLILIFDSSILSISKVFACILLFYFEFNFYKTYTISIFVFSLFVLYFIYKKNITKLYDYVDISKTVNLALSYFPKRISVFIQNVMSLSIIHEKFTSHSLKNYFVCLSYLAIFDLFTQGFVRWYLRENLDSLSVRDKLLNYIYKYKFLLCILYLLFSPLYLVCFSIDITFNNFLIIFFLFLSSIFIFLYKKIMVKLVVVNKVFTVNVIITILHFTLFLILYLGYISDIQVYALFTCITSIFTFIFTKIIFSKSYNL